MFFNSSIFTITIVSLVVVGIMELLKKYLPTKLTNGKILGIISLGLSVVFSILYSLLIAKLNWINTIVSVIGVVGITQVSYNFVLKLLKNLADKLQDKVEENVAEVATKKASKKE